MTEFTPVNIVQIGYGYWGTNVARNIMQSRKTNMIAMSDAVPARLEAAKNVYGSAISDYTADYEKYLDDPKVDAFALVIQTEPSFEVAKKILKAGKHLFIEKPMASDTARAVELTRLAHENHVVLHTDHIMIFHPIIRYIKKMYDEGELGDLIYFDISRMNLGPIRKDVNAMLDLAVHDLAVIDFISGGKEPYHVEAIGEKHYGSQETLTYLTLKYDGFLAHVKSVFGLQVLRCSTPVDVPVSCVAVCGGSGSSLIGKARSAGAQAYLCGDISYHHFFTSKDFMVIDIGHFEGEVDIVDILFTLIRKKFPTFAVHASSALAAGNPVHYFI